MKKVITYYADGYYAPFGTEEEALKFEEDSKKRQGEWDKTYNPVIKLEQLKLDLDGAMYIWPGTIATCTVDCLKMKALIRVCQKFTEDNKEYSKYY